MSYSQGALSVEIERWCARVMLRMGAGRDELTKPLARATIRMTVRVG